MKNCGKLLEFPKPTLSESLKFTMDGIPFVPGASGKSDRRRRYDARNWFRSKGVKLCVQFRPISTEIAGLTKAGPNVVSAPPNPSLSSSFVYSNVPLNWSLFDSL